MFGTIKVLFNFLDVCASCAAHDKLLQFQARGVAPAGICLAAAAAAGAAPPHAGLVSVSAQI